MIKILMEPQLIMMDIMIMENLDFLVNGTLVQNPPTEMFSL